MKMVMFYDVQNHCCKQIGHFQQNGAAIGRSADGFLNLYTPQPNRILMHRIDEKTLQIKRSVTLSVPLLVSGILNVTHRKENNFLSALFGNEEKRYFMGFGLTNSGIFVGIVGLFAPSIV